MTPPGPTPSMAALYLALQDDDLPARRPRVLAALLAALVLLVFPLYLASAVDTAVANVPATAASGSDDDDARSGSGDDDDDEATGTHPGNSVSAADTSDHSVTRNSAGKSKSVAGANSASNANTTHSVTKNSAGASKSVAGANSVSNVNTSHSVTKNSAGASQSASGNSASNANTTHSVTRKS